MSKKLSELSPRERQRSKSKKYITNSKNKSKNKITVLKEMEKDELYLSDIPEIDLNELGKPTIGKFYRPIKKPVSIRLDADVLAWFKLHAQYQTLINNVCRHYMV